VHHATSSSGSPRCGNPVEDAARAGAAGLADDREVPGISRHAPASSSVAGARRRHQKTPSASGGETGGGFDRYAPPSATARSPRPSRPGARGAELEALGAPVDGVQAGETRATAGERGRSASSKGPRRRRAAGMGTSPGRRSIT
jgi:hypothetical protein